MASNDNDEGVYTNNDSIQKSMEAFNDLMESNDLKKTLEKIESYCDKSPYHSALKAWITLYGAFLTMDMSDLNEAEQANNDLYKLTNKLGRSGFVVSVMKFVKTPNYQKYTDMEAHSEILHALSMGLSVVVCLLSTQNIYGLIKLMYRMQRFNKALGSAKIIKYKKTNWDNNESELNFEACVRFLTGISHLIVSKIPPKILKVANFFGYYGDGQKGADNLYKSAFQLPGIFNIITRLWLIFSWTFAEAHLTLGSDNLAVCSQVVEKELDDHPQCLYFKYFEAKIKLISGQLDEAIVCFKKLEDKTGRAQKFCYWELTWCFALKCQWDECIKYAELFRVANQNFFSAYSTFSEAAFRYAKSIDDNDPEMKQKASELFKIVPDMRVRRLGKTFTPEKMAVVNSEKYFQFNETLILPEMDILYQFNCLTFIKGDELLLKKHLDRVDKQTQKYKYELETEEYLDNYLTTLFFKGVLLKFLGEYSEAKSCFGTIVDEETRINREFSLVPQALCELGLIGIQLNKSKEAQEYLERAVNGYDHYLNENFVHLKALAGLRLLGITTDQQHQDENNRKQLDKEWLRSMNINNENYDKVIQQEQSIIY